MERLLYHGQDSLRSNLGSGKTRSAAYRCSQTRPLTSEPPHGYVAWALTALFLRSSGQLQHRPRHSNRCVGQTRTVLLSVTWAH